jgi:16S rRNA (uracil1498-N3)-methyltransferase
MRRHRFIGPFDLTQTSLRLFETELVRQVSLVLKLKPGEEIVLCDGKGKEAVVRLTTVEKKEVTGEVVERMKNTNEPTRHVVLYCAVLKRENFELVVQKATEVGVAEIVPLITRRTVKTGLKLERLRQIAKEAAEQSGRGVVPVVHEAIGFEEAIEQAKKLDQVFFLDMNGSVIPLKTGIQPKQKAIGLFVGPEGGWDPDEVAQAKRAGFTSASLGKLVLRAETAAVVGSYLLIL